jgi:hypothetical protein
MVNFRLFTMFAVTARALKFASPNTFCSPIRGKNLLSRTYSGCKNVNLFESSSATLESLVPDAASFSEELTSGTTVQVVVTCVLFGI